MKHNNKLTIVINGRGGVGKDTLCDFAAERFRVRNVSSVDPIKAIAREHGWNGEKDLRSRKFLSDLKRTFTEYNDLPNAFLQDQHTEFLACDEQIMFCHIREGEQIDAFKRRMEGHLVLALLIRREGEDVTKHYGNVSDDEVENYPYDYFYDNNAPLEQTPEKFAAFLANIAKEQGIEL